MEAIVSDSTAIITLSNISRIDILTNLFDCIYIPEKVYEEIVCKEDVSLEDPFFTENSIIKKCIEDKALYRLLEKSLDEGESEAIVLALEMELPLLIDEKKGRKIASHMNVKIIGLIGLLILNVKQKQLSSEQVLEVYYSAKSDGFRIGEKLEDDFMTYMKGCT